MGDTTKRAQESQDQGQRKKHHPDDRWSHYEVSGQFNACMDDPEGEDNKRPDTPDANEKGRCEKQSNDQICLDGDLKGDAHVNSKGLIVGQAEVQSESNTIDVNFEMQANEKRTGDGPSGPGGPGGPGGADSNSDDGNGEKPESSKKNKKSKTSRQPTPQADSQHTNGTNGCGEKSETDSPSSRSTGSEETEISSTTSFAKSEEVNSPNCRVSRDLETAGSVDTEQTSVSSHSSGNGNGTTSGVSEDTNSADSKEDASGSSGGDAKEEIRSSTSSTEPYSVSSVQVNQAPFIQKLHAMLEDPKLEHIIRWSEVSDRFFINPNEQFSQTLCLYFKHTNISSFVRQLSMYGFHKVSNSGQQRDKWYPWEFRHMDGLFRRGDLEAIRSIKRRPTRQMNGKRIKYLSVMNGNDYIKQEHASPSYIPGPPPSASPAAQVLSHYIPDQHVGPIPAIPFAAHYQSPMVHQPMGYDVSGHARNGHAGIQNTSGHGTNGTSSGTNGNGISVSGNGMGSNSAGLGMNGTNVGVSAPGDDNTMALVKMHHSVQTQLAQVQETVSRLSQNVNDMGTAIGHLISQQQVPNPAILNGTPQQSNNVPHSEASQIFANGQGAAKNDAQPSTATNGRTPSQDEVQNRFELRALLN